MYKLFYTYALLIFCFAFSGKLLAQNEFTTTWQTTDGSITIPTISVDSLTYDYDIEWINLTNPGEGNGSASGVTGDQVITDLNNGDTYEIKISGAFPAIYFLGSPDDAPKIQTIEQWGDIEWQTMYFAFYGCSNLISNANDAPNLEQVASMIGMLALTNINSDLNNWDVSNVTNFVGVFFEASAFNGNISNWNVSNATDMQQMFDGASSFNRELNNWNVLNVTNMSRMFRNATSFNGNISNWNTTSVENMSNMFNGATSFNQNLNDWSVSDVLTMSGMFRNASAFNSELDDWFTGSLTNLSNMFSGASSFNQPLGDWYIINVNNMSGMLDNCGMSKINYDATLRGWESFFNTPSGITLGAAGLNYCNGADSRTILTGTTLSWVINGDELECDPFITTWQTNDTEITIPTLNSETYFYNISWTNVTNPGVGEGSITGRNSRFTITGLNNDDIYEVSISGDFPRIYFPDFNVDAVNREKIRSIEQWGDQEWTSMSSAFSGCVNLVSNASDSPLLLNATSLSNMFGGATSFTGDLSNWDVSTIEDMSNMFQNATSFNGDLNNWDVSNVNFMSSMFNGASSFNRNLNNWDVSNVNYMSSMFSGASTFNRNLNSWDVRNVQSMNGMFREATTFNGDLSDWSVNNVTNMSRMFKGASSFNGDLSEWNVGNVNGMGEMFEEAIAFNSDIGDWDVRNVTEMDRMFHGATAFNRDLDDWNVSNVRNMGGMFWNATSFNQNLKNWDLSSVQPFEVESTPPFGLDSLFTNSGLSRINYDSTLIGWATLSAGEEQIPSNLNLGAQNLNYCLSDIQRSRLIDDFDWNIYDNGPECEEPSTQASNISFSNISLTQMDVSWTNGDGASRLVIAKESSEVNANPDDLTSYAANAVLGNGDELGSGNFVVYRGEGNSFTLSGLSDGTTYHLQIFEFNGANNLENYNINTATGNPAFQATLSIPEITDFTPKSAGPGITVTISGSGFNNTSLVSFGGTEANSFTTESDTVITAIVGEGASGEVLVTTPGGTATKEGFEFVAPPVITSFNPTSSTTGDIVTIEGLNFTDANLVSFGGAAASSFTLDSDTVITAVVGEGTSGEVAVRTPGGTATLDGFTFTFSQIALFWLEDNPIFNNQTDTVDFGTIVSEETFERQITIENDGDADLIISNISSSENVFEVINVPDTVKSGTSDQFILQLNPAEFGAYTSEISIVNNSIDNPEFNFTVNVEYSDLNVIDNETDSIVISNEDVNLGTTFINQNLDKTFIIENRSSKSSIDILRIEVDNPVFQIINAPLNVPPLSSDEFEVRLNATTVGEYTGFVTIMTSTNNFSFRVLGTVLEASTEIKVFNVVTPNGDGRHDFLQIDNIAEYPNNIVSIFNRWGNKIFEVNNYNNNDNIFEGISDNGKELLTGNYYYVIDKGNGDKRISGFLLLKR
ncbi:BspA family leucine-rich repeat surface protein [Marivirga tractuosa]|uniref:BspA family leucine-rich repeat surface protein n=1 Tax=Marivirga tractuosa TaxID=1006 RepID=UPI0035CEA974